MKIHFIPREDIEIGHALCYINPKDLQPLMEDDKDFNKLSKLNDKLDTLKRV